MEVQTCVIRVRLYDKVYVKRMQKFLEEYEGVDRDEIIIDKEQGKVTVKGKFVPAELFQKLKNKRKFRFAELEPQVISKNPPTENKKSAKDKESHSSDKKSHGEIEEVGGLTRRIQKDHSIREGGASTSSASRNNGGNGKGKGNGDKDDELRSRGKEEVSGTTNKGKGKVNGEDEVRGNKGKERGRGRGSGSSSGSGKGGESGNLMGDMAHMGPMDYPSMMNQTGTMSHLPTMYPVIGSGYYGDVGHGYPNYSGTPPPMPPPASVFDNPPHTYFSDENVTGCTIT